MRRHGEAAWVGLALYVIGYDVYAIKSGRSTLSAAFFSGFSHKVGRFGVIVAWVMLTGHLFRVIPKRFDPLRSMWG